MKGSHQLVYCVQFYLLFTQMTIFIGCKFQVQVGTNYKIKIIFSKIELNMSKLILLIITNSFCSNLELTKTFGGCIHLHIELKPLLLCFQRQTQRHGYLNELALLFPSQFSSLSDTGQYFPAKRKYILTLIFYIFVMNKPSI